MPDHRTAGSAADPAPTLRDGRVLEPVEPGRLGVPGRQRGPADAPDQRGRHERRRVQKALRLGVLPERRGPARVRLRTERRRGIEPPSRGGARQGRRRRRQRPSQCPQRQRAARRGFEPDGAVPGPDVHVADSFHVVPRGAAGLCGVLPRLHWRRQPQRQAVGGHEQLRRPFLFRGLGCAHHVFLDVAVPQ